MAAPPGPAAQGHTGHGLDPSSIIGPAGAGFLAKLAAAAGTKAAIVAGSAAVIVGGGLAVRESRRDGAAADRTGVAAAAARVAPVAHEAGGGHHVTYGSPHDAWAEHRHAVAKQLSHGDHGGDDHPGTTRHSAAAAPHLEAVREPAHAGDGSTTTAASHHSTSGPTSTAHEADGEH
jgi:hypothetical protein